MNMSISPTNRTVVITGASAGIGRALALEYAARGCRLGLLGRRQSALESLRAEIVGMGAPSAEIAVLDVDDVDSVRPCLDRLFERIGAVDVFVANAGINGFTRVGAGDFAVDRRIIQTNVLGALACLDAAAAQFIARRAGHLVGISSLASMIAVPTQGAYCASKAALSAYLRTARIELARHGIRVSNVTPGFVLTEIMPDIGKYPFAIPAAQAAREIADALDAGQREVIVPGWPWKLFKPFFGFIPDSMWRRFG